MAKPIASGVIFNRTVYDVIYLFLSIVIFLAIPALILGWTR